MTLTASVGLDLPELRKVPNEVALFSYSAVTWNQHRIHYDRANAQAEGHRDLVVQGNLQGEWLLEMLTSWLGTSGRVRELRYRHLRRAYVNESFVVRGVITGIEESVGDGVYDIGCDVSVTGPEGRTTLGSAVLEVPTICLTLATRTAAAG